jgi:signal transduction histidine kinase
MDRSEAKCFLELDIGHDSLSEWRTAPHRKYVVERFKKLLFIPLRDPEETIIAYLVLYSNEFKYSKNAQNDILHFQKVCGNVLHSLVSENQRLLRERRKIGHEIARQLANAGRRVDLFIETIKEKKSLRPNDALTFLMDIKGGLRTAQDTAGNETFREGVLRRVPVSSFIYLHEQYLSSSHLALSEYSRHRVELSTTTSIPFDTQVKVHRVDLDLLVSNLVSNAAKYSTPGGVIRTNWREVGNQYQLEVSNMSDPLSREELEKVTRFGVRGSNSGNVKGDGVGLAIVSDICGAYGITFEIFQTSGGVTWTHARVGIPKRMVRR